MVDRSITLYLPLLLRRERARDERLDLSRTSTRRDCDVRAFFAMTESKRRPWLLLVPVHERCKSGHNCVPSLSHLFTALSVFVSVYVPDFWSRSFFESLLTLPSAIVAYRDRQIRGSFGQCFARLASMPMTRLFENNSWNCRTR